MVNIQAISISKEYIIRIAFKLSAILVCVWGMKEIYDAVVVY